MTNNDKNEPAVDAQRLLNVLKDDFKFSVMNVANTILSETDLHLSITEKTILSVEIAEKTPNKTTTLSFPINEEHFSAYVIEHAKNYVTTRDKYNKYDKKANRRNFQQT